MLNKKNLILLISAIIMLILSIVWTILVSNNIFYNIDNTIVNFVVNNRGNKNNILYYICRILTEIGFIYFIIPVIIVILILCKFDLKSFILAIGTLFQFIINTIIKNIIKRPRPDKLYHWMNESSFSYPSGHSMTSCFMYGFIIFIIIKSNFKNKTKIILSIISTLAILTVGFTRIILSVHYFSDVLGGFLWGVSLILFSVIIYNIFICKYNGLKNIILKHHKE